MTAPGAGFGEKDDEAKSPPAAGEAPAQPDWTAPWEPPASPPAGYPGPAYPTSASSTEYQAGYAAPYPPQFSPPPGYEPSSGYEQPPGYGAPPYQPGPPQFGGMPSGYGPAPYSGGYYPAPDYPPGYGHREAMKPGTNGLAIASLISSFTGVFCCIGSIVAIVLGAIALDQVKRTRQDGYGLAVAGIVIGIATLVVGSIIVMFAMHSR
ncbi:MAG TPA: DUF4190 domain-containing protein [Mycobacterium sp.]|nr:DUF4190 domain-containing protein [Mycobacterium sp.]HTX93700.1 DUF4190 domain-containing protein [Mycobacterium sp.]